MLNVNRTFVIGLVVLLAVLTVISITLAITLYRRQRFIPVNGNNPYIMFDNRTAQACWSGPPVKPTTEEHTSAFEQLGIKPNVDRSFKGPNMGSNDLPYCKDLR